MGASPNTQRVRLGEIPTWAEDFNKNRVELSKYVASAGDATRKYYSVDWDINSRVSLYEGDITCIEADAIVSYNKCSLKASGGLSTAIEQAAGKGLTEEMAELNGCQIGEAKTTAGYNLPAKYIVHTVGPQDNDQQLMDKCYKSCLQQMMVKQMNSLVFCCISASDFGFPKTKEARVALKRVRLWLDDLKKRQSLDKIGRIVFCLFTPTDVFAYKAWIQVYFPCGSKREYSQWIVQQKISNPQPLDGFIQITTTEPDMITLDDDPNSKRAKMPCGHVIGPVSMTEYSFEVLNEGKYLFSCPDPGCNADWQYFLVRHVVCLTPSQMQVFENIISENFIKREEGGVRRCPGCDIYCSRKDKTKNCAKCLFCSKIQGVEFLFCWVCLGTWKVGKGNGCGNTLCDGTYNRATILASCPDILILGKFEVPSMRGCPKCGMLIEYLRACTQMHCNVCDYFFCFLCLEGAETKKELKCDPYNSTCKIAPRQTELPGM